MIQVVQQLERSIKDRRDSDNPLMNWWLYMLVVVPVTAGIWGVVIQFQRISRIDKFIARKLDYYNYIISFTEQYAKENGNYDAIHNDLSDLKEEVNAAFSKKIKPINALVAIILGIVTLGIWSLVVMYKMNKVWYDLQVTEQDFDDKLSTIWERLGLIKYPLSFKLDASLNRSFALYLILSVVTLGVWALVWDYKLHHDPEVIYKEFHAVEDTVLQTVRK